MLEQIETSLGADTADSLDLTSSTALNTTLNNLVKELSLSGSDQDEITLVKQQFSTLIEAASRVSPAKFDPTTRSRVERKESVPPKIKVGSLSREGKLSLKFNQPFIVPPFIAERQGRQLVDYSEINVARDILQVSLLQQPTELGKNAEFGIILEEWTSEKLAVKLNFSDPLIISQGTSPDSLSVKIKDPELFVAKDGFRPITEADTSIESIVPRQFPNWITEESVESYCRLLSRILLAIFGLFLFGALLYGAKPVFLGVLRLYLFTQLVSSLTVYQVAIPANTEILLAAIEDLVNFEWLNPSTYLLDFELPDFLENEPTGLIAAMPMQIVIIALLLVFWLLIGCHIKALKPNLRASLQIVGNVTFVNWALVASTHLGSFIRSETWQVGIKEGITLLLAIGVVSYPIIVWRSLLRNKLYLHSVGFYHKFKALVFEIHLTRSPSTVLFYPISLIRRLAFVVIPVVLEGRPGYQVQCLLLLLTIYVMTYSSIRPHTRKSTTRLEVVNECCLMVCTYHLVVFSAFSHDLETQFLFGFVMQAFVILIMFVNVYSTLKKFASSVLISFRKRLHRRAV